MFTHRGLKRTTEPAALPVTIQQVKDQLKISDSTQNDTIETYIRASVDFIENRLGLALITQVWRMVLDRWPGARDEFWDGVRQTHINQIQASGETREIKIPRYPLQTVDAITCDGNAVTVSTVFAVDTFQNPGRIALKFGQVWPSLVNATINGIEIDFTAGYGAAAEDVPADLKLAIIQMAAYLFTHRGDGCEVMDAFNESGAKGLCSNYSKARF